MKTRTLLVLLLPALAVAAASLPSSATGAFPGKVTLLGIIPLDVARQAPACGLCHNAFPGNAINPITAEITPAKLILTPGEQIAVTTKASGGTVSVGSPGGFVTEVTAGTLTAGTNSQTNPAGTHATHISSVLSNNRTWTYGYTASLTPGLVEVFGAVNTVNGDLIPNTFDTWAFHGFDQNATIGTPVRMFVLGPDFKPLGDGCPDGFGNFAVFGGTQPPTIGNAAFLLEMHGAQPGQLAFALISIAPPPPGPFPLAGFGIQGCFGHINIAFDSYTTLTSLGDSQRAEGSAKWSLPIPNLPALAGLPVSAQAAYTDPSAKLLAGRTLPVTFTNGITFVLK